MKNKFGLIIISVIILIMATLTQCQDDFLNIPQKGVLTAENLSDPEYIDGFMIAAYGWPIKQGWPKSIHPCYYGCVRSDDSYKGAGGGLTAEVEWYQMEVFTLAVPTGDNQTTLFLGVWEGIGRCNTAIKVLRDVDVNDYPLKEQRIGEMRFLRGYEYFQIKTFHRWVPYIDENVPIDEYETVGNRDLTDLELWQKILDDFEAAYNVLPETQEDKGRPTKYAAEAFMVKTLLWMAYEMDANHQVVNINTARLNEALQHCNNIINSGQYSLCSDFAHNFLCSYDNNTPESIWEYQHTINDGTVQVNTNKNLSLNTPTWMPYYRCCDYHKMSYDYINSTRTGADGLPLFDTYNDAELKDHYYEYYGENTFDPRLSHTAAIVNHPWAYNKDLLYDSAATPHGVLWGYSASLKEQVDPFGPCQYENRSNSKNTKIIRYSEILLWKAEILIKLGREDEALPIINEIRQRAANSTDLLTFKDGTPLLNYNIQPYDDGVNCTWDNDFAWKALIWESRMEFAGEGRRFFDLVRWGIAEEVMNKHFEKEKNRLSWLSVGHFTSGRDEFIYIPQAAITWSKGKYVQNPGY
jgi:hypothetical protein